MATRVHRCNDVITALLQTVCHLEAAADCRWPHNHSHETCSLCRVSGYLHVTQGHFTFELAAKKLVTFFAGETRWDIRMAAWLLYLKQHPGPLWASYMQHLPREQDMCCLLNYSRDEIHELQIPALQVCP